jgi:hypothetical protein
VVGAALSDAKLFNNHLRVRHHHCSSSMPARVTSAEIEPPYRLVAKDWRGFDRGRLISAPSLLISSRARFNLTALPLKGLGRRGYTYCALILSIGPHILNLARHLQRIERARPDVGCQLTRKHYWLAALKR